MQSGLRQFDVVELADESVHHRRPLAATIGAGEQPGLASETDTTKRPLRSIVREADATDVEETGEAVPALQPVFSSPSSAERTNNFALMGPAGKTAPGCRIGLPGRPNHRITRV